MQSDRMSAGVLLTAGATCATSFARLREVPGTWVAAKVKFNLPAASVKVRETWNPVLRKVRRPVTPRLLVLSVRETPDITRLGPIVLFRRVVRPAMATLSSLMVTCPLAWI